MAYEPNKPQQREAEFNDPALEPDQARHLARTLRSLADGSAGGEIQDVAKKLLSGRLELHDVLTGPASSRALGAGLSPLQSQWESLSEEQREAVREGKEQAADGEQPRPRDADAPRTGGRRPRQVPARHESGGWSAY